MNFPLMHGYDRIDLVADLDPVAAVRDRELGERIREYPKLFPAGSPDFGFAVQSGTRWRIGSVGTSDPEGARRSLASHLRRSAAEEEPAPELARAMTDAAGRLDPEEGDQLAKDEWEIGERRYRVIRIERFTLIGGGAMEPPRSTDTDPSGPVLLRDHPIEPLAPAGHWETQLRLNLVGFRPLPGTVPDIVQAEAAHAIRSHPGVILLPPAFTVVEIEEDGAWQPLTGGDGPVEARDNLAAHFTRLMPLLRLHQGNPASAAELAEWERAAEEITATDGYEFAALGRRFRTVRISRMMRLGRDGPEGPRPSDQERYGMPAVRKG
ncbi:DUF5954 family protein [Actinomadura bangladeshensis]|uniref:PE-PGRS family protein n=1 Tax=Actinomadura bangladeshensis TaxID=453573 RepID=A0A6L9QHG7_9ACTN|nr:hypothetical protein [Actinomadura bangladeshensis]